MILAQNKESGNPLGVIRSISLKISSTNHFYHHPPFSSPLRPLLLSTTITKWEQEVVVTLTQYQGTRKDARQETTEKDEVGERGAKN